MNSAAHCEHGHYRGVHCPHGCYIVDATGEWSNTKKMADTLRAENEALKKERDKAVAACNLGIRPDIYEKRVMERDAVRAELAEAKAASATYKDCWQIAEAAGDKFEAELAACREANEAMRAALEKAHRIAKDSWRITGETHALRSVVVVTAAALALKHPTRRRALGVFGTMIRTKASDITGELDAAIIQAERHTQSFPNVVRIAIAHSSFIQPTRRRARGDRVFVRRRLGVLHRVYPTGCTGPLPSKMESASRGQRGRPPARDMGGCQRLGETPQGAKV